MKFWVPYLAMFVINMAIVLMGLTLLIIPGIYIALRLSFAPFELLLEGLKPIDSLRSSWKLTKGHVGQILGGGIVIYFSFFVPFGVLGTLFDQSSVVYLVYYTIGSIFSSLVGALFTIFVFRIYWLVGEQHNKSLNSDAGDAGAG